MKLAALVLITATVPEPPPVMLDARSQMEMARVIAGLARERDSAQQEAVYWYQQWKNKKGLCA